MPLGSSRTTVSLNGPVTRVSSSSFSLTQPYRFPSLSLFLFLSISLRSLRTHMTRKDADLKAVAVAVGQTD